MHILPLTLALKSKILCFYLFSTFSSLETVQSKRREKALANQEVTSPGSKVSQDNGCTVDKYVLPLGTPCVFTYHLASALNYGGDLNATRCFQIQASSVFIVICVCYFPLIRGEKKKITLKIINI